MAFCFCPLRSGSNGNSLFVQGGSTSVLVDAGLSGKTIELALSALSVRADSIHAILISHEHSDHIKGAGILSRRYQLPIYATEKTWLEMEKSAALGKIAPQNRRIFAPHEDFYIGDLAVSPFPIPHDAADPVGFSLMHAGKKLCIATDLGHIGSDWMDSISGADLLLLESNHDPDMLRCHQRYPALLKKRILSKHGHLSNGDCAKALIQLAGKGLTHVILGHLSGETNTPELARETVCAALLSQSIRPDIDIRVDIAVRDQMGKFYTIA